MKTFLTYSLVLLLTLCRVSTVHALSLPDFSSCSQPSGSVRVHYDAGTHGIVGHSETFTGSDTVYQLSSEQVLQCFCSDQNNDGIQTLWWKVTTQTPEEIDQLLRSGWISIPNGALWGLDNARYLTKNSSYHCGGVGGYSTVLGINTLAATGDINSTWFSLAIGSLMIATLSRSRRKR